MPGRRRCQPTSNWGATRSSSRSSADRDTTVTRTQELVGILAVPRWDAEMFGALGRELIVNATYNAPVDLHGRSHGVLVQIDHDHAASKYDANMVDGRR